MGKFRDSDHRQELVLREALFSTALDAIIIIDSDSRIIEFNAAAEQTFGHRRSDVLGKDMADIIVPPALREAHHGGMATYLKTGQNAVLGRRIEVPALHKSGKELLVELAVSAVELEDGTYFAAYLRDITADRAQRQALEASEHRYQDLFERSGDAIFVHTLDGIIRDMNDQAERLVGRKRETLIGEHVRCLHPVEALEASKAAVATLEAEGSVRADVDFINADGEVIPTEVHARSYESERRDAGAWCCARCFATHAYGTRAAPGAG